MAQTSAEQALKLPLWFVKCCRWFWKKKWRVWGLIGSTIISLLIWFIGVVLTTTTTEWQTFPLRGVIDFLTRNAVLYFSVLFVLFVILLFFTLVAYIVSHIPETLLPSVRQDEKRKSEQRQLEEGNEQKR